MSEVIEIDTTAPCVSPRRTPDQRLSEALALIAIELIGIEDAIRKGAVLTDDQKRKLVSIGTRMVRRAG